MFLAWERFLIQSCGFVLRIAAEMPRARFAKPLKTDHFAPCASCRMTCGQVFHWVLSSRMTSPWKRILKNIREGSRVFQICALGFEVSEASLNSLLHSHFITRTKTSTAFLKKRTSYFRLCNPLELFPRLCSVSSSSSNLFSRCRLILREALQSECVLVF